MAGVKLDLGRLMGEYPIDDHMELASKIPREIGRFQVFQRTTRTGISVTDWRMEYEKDTWVERRNAEGTDAFLMIFFMNRPLDWDIPEKGMRFRMEAGDACVYRNRDYSSSAWYQGGCEMVFKSLQMPTGQFQGMVEDYFGSRESRRLEELCLKRMTKIRMNTDMYRILRELQRAGHYGNGAGVLFLESNVMELLAVCMAEILKGDGSAGLPELRLTRTQLSSLRSIKERIDRQPEESFAAGDLAREAGMGLTRFSQGFAEVAGMPLHAYVIDRRLAYAASLLSGGERNVSQAGALAGYTNMSHFAAAFKKKYGVLPRDFMRG